MPKRNKYHAHKVILDGITFASEREYKRYFALKQMQMRGEIRDLQTQVKYVLIPSQRTASDQVYKRGSKKGQFKPGTLIEKECAYIADFQYFDKAGNLVVEDSKGFRTKEYKIKRKLMLYMYGIKVRET